MQNHRHQAGVSALFEAPLTIKHLAHIHQHTSQNVYANDNKFFKPGDVVSIVMVSHSNLMRDRLLCGKTLRQKPLNNEPWLQMYYMPLGDGPLMPTGYSCNIINKDLIPKLPKPICSATVERCVLRSFKRTEAYYATRKGCSGNPVCPAS